MIGTLPCGRFFEAVLLPPIKIIHPRHGPAVRLRLRVVGRHPPARTHGSPVLGIIAGTALTGVLLGLQLTMRAGGPGAVLQMLTVLSFVALVPSYLAWSVWSGARLSA